MRTIEQQMIAALRTGRAWQSGNTAVTARDADGCAAVYLHGNHVADWRNGRAEPNLGTLARWPTVTTKSRLRALGVDIYQQKGCIYVDGAAIT